MNWIHHDRRRFGRQHQRRETRLFLFGALAISTLVVTACTEPGNNPAPSSTTATSAGTATTSTTLPGAGDAPKVANPLTPGSVYWTDPCKLLTPAQLSKLNLPDAVVQLKSSYPGGPACSVISHDTGSRADVQAPTTSPHGLSSLYELHKKHPEEPLGYFIPTSVTGFPAVLEDATDSRNNGTCYIYVGVNDQQVFSVHYDTLLDKDETKLTQSCTLAKQTATQVIVTLQKDT